MNKGSKLSPQRQTAPKENQDDFLFPALSECGNQWSASPLPIHDSDSGKHQTAEKDTASVKKPPPKIADHHLGTEVKGYPVFLMDIDDIRPTEETDPENLAFLRDCLIKDNVLQKPLAIEREHKVLMDGHHRFSILRSFGCLFVPVVAFDYGDVKVVSWADGKPFDYREIVKRGLSGDLFPAKTTRHIFPVDVTCNIPLSVLTAATFKDQ